ncbi:MAG: hypothetical protein LBT48_08215 [Prevotellaceae bacterium]|nr:hypothetical protein [Prevotellaceae bacterium]
MINTRYLRRALKSILMFCIIACLIYVAGFYFGASSNNQITLKDLLLTSNLKLLVIFLLVFGLVHPLFGYIKQRIYVNHPLDGEKQDIIRRFANANFKLESDDNKKMVFRHQSHIVRFTRLYEDRIEVDYSSNPVTVDGLRRDADRLARAIQEIVQHES